ncbi:hypothetical protein L2E82_28058 [Cichorium intybus]|uniref:Uncharacterized protein n=1 Tax=Cichorium intybus TaxID=13427 RepID=A0ACB9CUV6_CICIN|nr:hypothetical protein L2E82_28058 [Cichorium intybus]
MNICDDYQPSQNSVMEPDNSSISEWDDNFTIGLHVGIRRKRLNESNHEIVTSSDGDATERCFGPKESQEFSYLVNVLNEIGSFETWHSVEHMLSQVFIIVVASISSGRCFDLCIKCSVISGNPCKTMAN